jgi:hypothetical protein
VRKVLVLLVIMVALLAAGRTLADPGPNGHNNHGLCTAYFNGQKSGHDHSQPKPFTALAEEAGDQDGDGDIDQSDVYAYCLDYGIGGQGSHGRYPECFDGDSDGDGDPCND